MKLSWFVLACLLMTTAFGATSRDVNVFGKHAIRQAGNGSEMLSPIGSAGRASPQAGASGSSGPSGDECHIDNGIYFHGGPVMTSAVHVYVIFYGSFSSKQQHLVTNFLAGLGHNGWWDIERTYRDANGKRVGSDVDVKGVTNIGYTRGQALNDYDIQLIVSQAISDGTFPSDEQGVYFVLTDTTVMEVTGFCSFYCGWHTYATIGSSNIKYSWVGNAADLCPYSCSAQVQSSPNNDIGIDAMISVIAHELAETVSDPNLNAWYDNWGEENGDKCAWTFGNVNVAPNGSFYNIVVNKVKYLIQQLWVNANHGYCAMDY